MQTTACLRKGDGYMDKSKTHILAFFTGHDAPEKKSVYVEMNGQGDELTRLVASVAIKMFSLGTTNKNIIQMRKQYLFDIINKWLDEDSVQDIELKEYSYEYCADILMQANPEQIMTFCFDSGVVLKTPELTEEQSGSLPPWKENE